MSGKAGEDFNLNDTVQRFPGTMTVTFTVGLLFKLAWCDPCSTSQHLILPPCRLPDDNDGNDDDEDNGDDNVNKDEFQCEDNGNNDRPKV